MHPILNIAVRAARNAANVILRHVDRLDALHVTEKRRNDYVSEVDRMAEREIIDTVRKAYPDHRIKAEESGEHGAADEHQWVVDPLDGTTNFLRGIPHFAISIGFKYRGRLEQGVIYDPIREELFTASRGGGAFLNDRRIRTGSRKGLDGALLATGFPFRHEHLRGPYLAMLRDLLEQTGDMRRAGTASLDLAYVAAGRLDGYWEFGLNEWDLAAGVVLVQEAGGLVGDFTGGHRHLETGHIVAASPKVFAAVLKTVHPHLPQTLRGV
jgi:myo-inositol-1(or 4)-monophosphatase